MEVKQVMILFVLFGKVENHIKSFPKIGVIAVYK
jgi:hypothetical protein